MAAVAFFCVALSVGSPNAQFREAAPPPAVRPQIVRVIKHDPAAFTQGLFIVDTVLYESTGLVGRSSLRRVNPRDGSVQTNIPVPYVFAEGIAAMGGELVQLTWKDGVALRYEFPSLVKKNTVYRYYGEGWGLTNDSTHFIMSNGTDTLYWRDAKFIITKKLPVTYGGRPLVYLNELEYARGRVYANVFMSNFIAEISAADGRVTRIIDCSQLVEIERPTGRDDVLNGVAYCGREGVWYLTGKNWRNMFVVRIPD